MSNTEEIKLFEKHKTVHPKKVKGFFRNLRWKMLWLLLAIYYITPWIRWNRGEKLPDQAVLIDISTQRAYFFNIEIWPQEVYFITIILILSAIGLFFVTSLFGRVWCGYACPQTIWTELFIWVEYKIQGDRNARIKLDKSPLTLQKIYKKGLTHFLWLVISLSTGGAFVLFFNDAFELTQQIINFNVSTATLVWIISLTASTYMMAGYAREHVCTYMCPYARFQSGMFDGDTLIIGYDVERGEQRGKFKKGDDLSGRGHCVDCTQCVQVCPQGIDIRDGLQMECIACGLCIDACDNVMEKLDLPKGLVRYDTQNRLTSNVNDNNIFGHLIRPRTIIYMAILCALMAVFFYNIMNRDMLEMNVVRDRNPIFVQLSDGTIRNGYDIKILNKTHEDRYYNFNIDGLYNAKLTLKNNIIVDKSQLFVEANSVGHFKLFISLAKEYNNKSRFPIKLVISDNIDGNQAIVENVFIGKK